METLLAFLTLGALIALLIGLVSPRTVTPWRSEPSRWFAAALYGSVLVGCFVVFGLTVEVEPLDPDRAVAADEAPEPDEPEEIRLQVQGNVTATEVRLIHTGSDAWTGCTVELNPGAIRSGYSQDVGRFAPGDTLTGGLMAFTRGTERFNPGTHVVETVRVTCDTPSGPGFWVGRMR